MKSILVRRNINDPNDDPPFLPRFVLERRVQGHEWVASDGKTKVKTSGVNRVSRRHDNILDIWFFSFIEISLASIITI